MGYESIGLQRSGQDLGIKEQQRKMCEWPVPVPGGEVVMSTKVPIYLKRGSRKGKKEKLRDLLSSDMISPPLGNDTE